MQTIMNDFYRASMVTGARDDMHLLILHGYLDNTVLVECSKACLENIHAAIESKINSIMTAEAHAVELEDQKDAWIEKHLYGGEEP